MRLRCVFSRAWRGLSLALLFLLALALCAPAQSTRASLKGSVMDPSGAVVPGAVVTLQPAGGPAKTATADNLGHFSFVGLIPGAYDIMAKKTGFAVYQMQSFPVSGDGSIDIQLSVAAESQEVTVSDDNTHVEVDPDRNASALVLKGTDLDDLSDDPDELQDDLAALAGPSAGPNGGQIYIDGFSGGSLPPKASIREIRINSNPFSAEYDRLGYGRIEIFTKPGMDKFRGQLFTSFNDNALNARNPFLSNKPAYQSKMYSGNLAGPLTKKMSFTLDFERRDIAESGILIGTQLNSSLQPTPFALSVPTPNSRMTLTPKLDIALSDKNTLTIRYRWEGDATDNQGVGGFSLASRAVNASNHDNMVQVTETSVLSAKAVNETRFMFDHSTSNSLALNDAAAISVSDSFYGGGSTTGHAWDTSNYYELNNLTTYTAGVHTIKWGGRARESMINDYSPSNFNGTFSFVGGSAPELDANNQPIIGSDGNFVIAPETSLERYRRTLVFEQLGYTPLQMQALGGGPSLFSIDGGNPLANVNRFDVGIFVTDDWRLRSNFTLSLGLRYENQTNISNMADFAPRIGFAWAVDQRKNHVAKTVIRGGTGLFYDRVGTGLTLSALRYNGITQQQYVVANPTFFPTVPSLAALAGDLQPTSTTEIYKGLVAPRIFQSGLSLERQLPKNTVATVTWAFSRGMHYLLSRDINAPLADGAYPYGNPNPIMLTESDGLFTQNQMIVNVNSRMSKKVSLFGFYTLGSANGNSDGGSPMNQYDLSSEWGPTRFDIRHRFFIGGSITAPLKLMFSPFITGSSGAPYNITTGNDFNGDLIYNERPAFATDPNAPGVVSTTYGLLNINPQPGDKIVPRNYGRGPAQFNLNLRLARTWGFGKSRETANSGAGGPPPGGGGPRGGMGGGFRGGPGGPGGMFGGGADTGKRYNLTLSASARNLLNYVNLASPDGNLSSPYFGQSLALVSGYGGAASVYNRRIDLQLRFTF
jgi:hypothetical protein